MIYIGKKPNFINKYKFMISVIFMTEAFPHPEYYSPTNQAANVKPSMFVGLYKVVYVVKLLTGRLP